MEEKKRIKRKNWVRLDNASNIFLAAMSNRDSKVFRFSAEVTKTVDPDLLQQALNKVYEDYKLYHSVLRRGVFWYYLEESDLKPTVRLDINPTCEPLYHFDRRDLLFRVVYWKKRISIEVFHVLSDGTGAMWFLQDLLAEYLRLRHPEIETDALLKSTYIHDKSSEDSFFRHFRSKEQRNFNKATQSALEKFGDVSAKAKNLLFPKVETDTKKVYHYKGTYTPDNRPRIVEMEMPVQSIIQLAKREKVSLTLYLTALFMESVRKSAPDFRGNETMAISVSVSLRQFFPSESARNFFAVTRLEYTYKEDRENTLSEICAEMKEQFDPQLTKEHLQTLLTRLIYYEYHPVGRLVPRPIKDIALKIINYNNNRSLTLAVSNLGRVSFPEIADPLIKQVYFHTIAVRPQFCAISHNDIFTISFTSPYIETAIYQQFASHLTKEGIPVTVTVNKVTEEELGGVH